MGLAILLTALSSSFLVNVTSAAPSAHRLDPTSSLDQWIDPTRWHSESAFYYNGTMLYGDLNVTSGGNLDIDFLICDSSNYQSFSNDQPYASLTWAEKVTTCTWNVTLPYSDTWYMVFSNKFSYVTAKRVSIDFGFKYEGPTITIIDPSPGDTVFGNVVISAAGSDTKGSVTIKSMSIEIDGTSMTTYQGSSINYAWNTHSWSEGKHKIRVMASDSAGKSTDKSITVTVANATFGIILLVVGILVSLLLMGILVALIRKATRASRNRAKPSKLVLEPTESVVKTVEKEVVETRPGFCPNCGAETPPGATYCKNCGANLRR